jgi:hypothetical protein
MHRRLAIAFAFVAALVAVPDAAAWVNGPCEATVSEENIITRGTSARSDAISVPQTGGVLVTMRSERPLERKKVEIEFAGIPYTVHDEPTTGTEWSSVVPIDDYATYGIGLYKIVATSTGPGVTCEAATLVDVQGEPFETAAGAIGLGLLIVGGLGVLSFLLRGGRTRLAPFLGAFLGIVFAIGGGALLQEFGLLYPTLTMAVGFLVGGAALGFIAGLVGSRAP